nr:MAG TPA: hypothetical protein [Bacteriophage sp.]
MNLSPSHYILYRIFWTYSSHIFQTKIAYLEN